MQRSTSIGGRETVTRLLLLRHAETAAPDHFHGAESDVGLGEHGHRQAEVVGRLLAKMRPDALYCSGMRRARETAAPIATACGLEIQVVEALHERRMGVMSGVLRWDGLPGYEATKARWMAGDLDATHEGAESYQQIRDRVVPAFLELAGASAGQTAVVVAHGVVIRVLIASLVEGFGPGDFDGIGIEFVAVNDLRWDGSRWWSEGVLGVGNDAPGTVTIDRIEFDRGGRFPDGSSRP